MIHRAPEHSAQRGLAKSRWDLFPLGIFAVLCFGTLVWVLSAVPPDRLRDLIWPSSYVLFLLLCWLFLSSFFTFLLLHTRRALLLSSFVCLVLWVQFQGALNVLAFFYLGVPFLITELVLTFSREK